MRARRLGRTDIEITPIGLGCMQFSGSRGLASRIYRNLGQDEVTQIVRTALDGGVGWFDTAEMYGNGTSERMLTTALKECDVPPGESVVATKWGPFGRTAGSIERTVDRRLDSLQGYPIALHQVHLPWGSVSGHAAQMRAMARLLKAEKIRSVGVSNFSAEQMVAAYEVLRAEGVTLAANQVQVSLVRREIERNGVLDAARRLGVTLIAYGPLANGYLTGRYHENPELARGLSLPRRLLSRRLLSAEGLARTAPLIGAMRELADAHGGTVAQVALNWLVSYYGDTVVAIPGASSVGQVAAVAGVLDFQLTEEELARLADLSGRLP